MNLDTHILVNDLAKTIDQHITSEINNRTHQFLKEIALAKEPYLRELLNHLDPSNPLEPKYTASDILTLLESLEEPHKRILDN